MLLLLQNVEAISACRDRGRLPRALFNSVAGLLGASVGVGLLVRDGQGETTLRLATGALANGVDTERLSESLQDIRPDTLLRIRLDERLLGARMLYMSELGGEQIILVYERAEAEENEIDEQIACLVRVYGHQVGLLDYSELDSLTRLLNRKSFDETFDRLVVASPANETMSCCPNRRDHGEAGSPAWLGVIDIDHFKRINDSFGHLFGDEVLLRMGDLMRKSFRGGDRLFRFGGEEFVVILNAEDETLAEVGFERFRQCVETHEFPQVGQVTCSLGFTAVSTTDVPTDVVGRADEALYFAKENGRNRVCCYERLVAEGVIAQPATAEAAVDADFDLDALFA